MDKYLVVGVLASISVLSGCSTLQGVPQGLSRAQLASLSDRDLNKNLDTGRDLSETWEGCRNEAQRYLFWSNAGLIPLASAGAATVFYKASKDVIGGIGIVAGTLIGINTFVNARSVAGAYQAGVNGLSCLTLKLQPYVENSEKATAADQLFKLIETLDSQLSSAKGTLQDSQSVAMGSKDAIKERNDNPTIVVALATNEKALSQALSDAQTALNAAQQEYSLFKGVAGYAAARIRDINLAVAGKVSPSEVNYANLVSSISSLTSVSTPPATTPATPVTQAVPSGANGQPVPAGLVANTPLATAADNDKSAAEALSKATKAISLATSDFGLNTRENEVLACVKAL